MPAQTHLRGDIAEGYVMTHGLRKFEARHLIEKAQSANTLIETALAAGEEIDIDALVEVVKVTLENQITIAETLDLIKHEFDKFEEGLDRIL